MPSSIVSIGLGLLAVISTAVATDPACQAPKPKADPRAAPGVEYKVLSNDLARPRGLVLDSEGNLLVVEASSKGVRRVVLTDADNLDVCVESSSQLINDSSVRIPRLLEKPCALCRRCLTGG